MTLQIFWGSMMLGVCSILHVGFVIVAINILTRLGRSFSTAGFATRVGVLLGSAFAVIVLSHTIQIWIWALSFVVLGAIPVIEKSIYFALVTYTTLGYGDVTLGANIGIYAAMAAVTGLLNFGLSTAFLVGVFAKLLPTHLAE